MNYSEMSDGQINDAVAIARGSLIRKGEALSLYQVEGEDLCTDFCNSWADAGPIIQRHKISLIWVKTEIPNRWDAGSPCHMKWATHEHNPLRAAMETFLKMQEQPDAT